MVAVLAGILVPERVVQKGHKSAEQLDWKVRMKAVKTAEK